MLSQNNPQSVIMLYRGKQKDWSFPKGHAEEGEVIQDTTLREVVEETGMPVRMVTGLSAMEYDHQNGDHIVVKMFLMQSNDDEALRVEHEGDRLIWVDYHEVADRLSYDNIKEWYRNNFVEIKKVILGLQSNIH